MIFLALAIFDTMVVVCVIVLKGWPTIVDSDDLHVDIFPVFHPILSLSLMMSIYLTILMTLERYAAVCWKRTQSDPKRMKLSVTILFLVCSLYTIPKCLEYTWNSRYTRRDYDLQESDWTNEVVGKLDPQIQIDYSLKAKGSLKFLEEHQEIVESEPPVSDCKSRNTQVVKM